MDVRKREEMKRLILFMIFVISSISFSINNEAMIDYIIKSSGGKTSRSDAQIIVNTVSRVSKQYNFPEAYIYGIIETESNFRNLKANIADARGVMQVTPKTSAAEVGCTGNLYNIEYNIECGVKYFDWMRKNAKHYGITNLSDLAAAYNCGPGCFKSGRWKNIKETTSYIKKVPSYGNKIATIAGLTPLDMTQFPAGTGYSDSSSNPIKNDFLDIFKIDFDGAVEIFKQGILSKMNNVINGVIVLLTFLALFDFILTVIIPSTSETSTILPRILSKMIKYAFYIGIVLNFLNIQSMIFEFFIGLAKAFGADATSANQVWELSMKETENVFNLVVSWNIKTDMMKWTLMPEIFIIVIAMLILLIVGIRVVIEVMMAIIQFFLTTTMALFFVIFDVFKKPSSLLNKLPTTFLLSGIKITVITVIMSVLIGTISNITISTATDIEGIKDSYESIFKYIGVLIIGAVVIAKSSKWITKEFSR